MGFNPFKKLKKLGSGMLNPMSALGDSSFLMGKDYSGKQKADILGVLGPLKGQLGMQNAAAHAATLKQLGAIQQGYGAANKALQMQGALGTKSILDQSKQAYAQNIQSLQQRGLSNTTTLDAANRASGYATNDALSQLTAQLATLGGNLAIGQGQGEAGVYGQMAGLNQNYSSLLAQLGLAQLGATQNVQYGKQGGALPGLMNLGGQVLGKGLV